jgi:hypothetical protein
MDRRNNRLTLLYKPVVNEPRRRGVVHGGVRRRVPMGMPCGLAQIGSRSSGRDRTAIELWANLAGSAKAGWTLGVRRCVVGSAVIAPTTVMDAETVDRSADQTFPLPVEQPAQRAAFELLTVQHLPNIMIGSSWVLRRRLALPIWSLRSPQNSNRRSRAWNCGHAGAAWLLEEPLGTNRQSSACTK